MQRNRVRRVFREAFRLSQHDLPSGFDFVLIPARPRLVVHAGSVDHERGVGRDRPPLELAALFHAGADVGEELAEEGVVEPGRIQARREEEPPAPDRPGPERLDLLGAELPEVDGVEDDHVERSEADPAVHGEIKEAATALLAAEMSARQEAAAA